MRRRRRPELFIRPPNGGNVTGICCHGKTNTASPDGLWLSNHVIVPAIVIARRCYPAISVSSTIWASPGTRRSWRRLGPVSPRGFFQKWIGPRFTIFFCWMDTDYPAAQRGCVVRKRASFQPKLVRLDVCRTATLFLVVTSATGEECKLSGLQGSRLSPQQRRLLAYCGRTRMSTKYLCHFQFTLGPSDLFEWIDGQMKRENFLLQCKKTCVAGKNTKEDPKTKRTYGVRCHWRLKPKLLLLLYTGISQHKNQKENCIIISNSHKKFNIKEANEK